MTEPRYPYQTNEDEIDLIELLQGLWGQKWLISAVISLALMFAVVYIFISKPVYSVTTVLAPAPVNAFGLIVGDIGVGQQQTTKSAIAIGTDLANDALALVVKNFESAAVSVEFNNTLKESGDYVVQVKRGKSNFDPVTVSVVSVSAEGAKKYLDGYMAYVTDVSAVQLNEYFQALGVSHSVSAESLYRVEQASALPAQPIKPKKPLIVALGLVLGGMLGVFIALIRLMLKKRSAKMAEPISNC
ncbi:G-rich domain on putative tyrosine kinase [Pseudomonas guineae]|uniref:G-rich domain on putative tyrosine kinase n=1 Tax=Pseudomonas guineae TaxID=425504 RepID=A0A1I3CVL2_9PSED|nr:G-rich domain on putative tyrosine kinase [Pseudomonas guineae]